jgi:hypothetical protein
MPAAVSSDYFWSMRVLSRQPDAGSRQPRLSHEVRLIVVEDGTNGAEDHALPNGTDATVLIAQGGGERPKDFAQRVIRRISVLEQLQQSVVSTTVMLSPRFDTDATAARVALAHGLEAHSAAASRASQLLLSAGSGLDSSLRVKVEALAELLTNGTTLPVSVQFAS